MRIRILLLLQLILVILIFHPYLSNDILFTDVYDGLKNYFTYHSYLTQPKDIGLLYYDRMNYPFGESIYYTDNTPLFSIIIKIICDYIYDVSNYSILIFNSFCVFSLLLTSYFCYKVLDTFIQHKWLIVFFSLVLPWFSPQLLRLQIGHYNLSFAWILLATIHYLISIYKTDYQQFKTIYLKQYTILFFLIFSSAFIHLYYLPMLGVLIGVFVVSWMIWEAKINKWQIPPNLYPQLSLLLLPLICIILVLGIIQWTDPHYAERTATGYNWAVWNFKIDALYSAYHFSSVPFLVSSSLNLHFESHGYLGGFALYGALFFGIYGLILSNRRQRFLQYFNPPQGIILGLIFLAGLVNLFISFGDYAKMFNNTLSFDNVFSPFYYLSALSENLTQFRVLARFNWIFFWSANFLIIYVLDRFLLKRRTTWQYMIVGLISILTIIDATDFMRLYWHLGKPKNLLSEKYYHNTVTELNNQIDATRYQAILPIPFFTAGSSKMENTILSSIDWNHKNYQMALATGLPMIPCFLSRSIDEQHRQLMTLFTNQPDENLLKRFNDQPILVYYSRQEADWAIAVENETARSYRDFGKEMPQRYNMKLLAQSEKWYLYEWNWNTTESE